MAIAPYPDQRPSTVSAITPPKVNPNDIRIVAKFVEGADLEYLAAIQHCHRRVEGSNEAHVVFDHDNGVVLGKLPNEVHRLDALLARHPRSRLVEQDD